MNTKELQIFYVPFNRVYLKDLKRGVTLSGKRLFHLLLITCLSVSVAFMAGCAQEYEVEVQAEPEEAGEVTGEGLFGEGEEITVDATPKEGYEFLKWEEEDKKVSGETDYSFEIYGDRTIIAKFAEQEIKQDLQIIETSLKRARLNDLVPLKENMELFKDQLDEVFRDLNFDFDEKDELPRICKITHIKLRGKLIELEKPISWKEGMFELEKNFEDIILSYEEEKITKVEDVLSEWDDHLQENFDQEAPQKTREKYESNRALLLKQDTYDHLVSFVLSWGSIISEAKGYIDVDTGLVEIVNFFSHGQVHKDNHKWSPCGNYHIYHIGYAGEGEQEIGMTDLNDLEKVKVDQPEFKASDYSNFNWGDDGKNLYFDIEKEVHEDDSEEISTWRLNLENREVSEK